MQLTIFLFFGYKVSRTILSNILLSSHILARSFQYRPSTLSFHIFFAESSHLVQSLPNGLFPAGFLSNTVRRKGSDYARHVQPIVVFYFWSSPICSANHIMFGSLVIISVLLYFNNTRTLSSTYYCVITSIYLLL